MAGHTGLVVVCTELCMGGSHPGAAELLSGKHRELKKSYLVQRGVMPCFWEEQLTFDSLSGTAMRVYLCVSPVGSARLWWYQQCGSCFLLSLLVDPENTSSKQTSHTSFAIIGRVSPGNLMGGITWCAI